MFYQFARSKENYWVHFAPKHTSNGLYLQWNELHRIDREYIYIPLSHEMLCLK